jgi:hypothetical protein
LNFRNESGEIKMNLTQIIAKAAERYRTSRSSANQGAAICDIQRQLFIELDMLKPQYSIHTDVTVADQASYELPTDCRIENVWSIQVEQSEGSEEFDDFTYAPFGQYNIFGNYYTRGYEEDEYLLFKDGEPVTEDDLLINIFYYPRPVNFDGSDLTVTPALDTDFHDYFWMKLIEDNASCGDYPDFVVANTWGNRGDKYAEKIKVAMAKRLNAASPMTMECDEYF